MSRRPWIRDRRAGAVEGDVRLVAGDAGAAGESERRAALGVPGAGSQGVAGDLCDGCIEADGSRLGLDGARVTERAVDQDRRCAGSGGLLDEACVLDLRLAAVVVRNA